MKYLTPLYRQYMFGPSLLVAPVFVPEGEETEYYLPAGRWTSFFHPERIVQGPVWVKEVVPIDEIPVWVRPNTVLPLGPAGLGRPDYALSDALEVRIYELDDGAKISVDVPTGFGVEKGGSIVAERKQGEVQVTTVGFSGIATVALYSGGQEVIAKVDKGASEVKITLK